MSRKHIPVTFTRLTQEVIVLMDPKHDRLLYLVGSGSEEESSSSDRIVEQLRALLRAAAAPYVHLMALPSRLRTTLLREFPGGSPIIDQVPLPPHLMPAPDTSGEERSDQQQQQQRGISEQQQRQARGVLGLLYGSADGPSWRSGGQGALGDAGANEALGFEEQVDVPDEVLSRRKKTEGLMAWLKGVSDRVVRRRDSRSVYKFQDLVTALNVLGDMTAFLPAPGMLFVRNHIADNLDIDMGPSAMARRQLQLPPPGLVVGLDGLEDEEEGPEEDEEEDDDGVTVVLDASDLEGIPDDDFRVIAKALQEMGMTLVEDSDDDEEDEEEDEEEDADEEEVSAAPAAKGDGSAGAADGLVEILSLGRSDAVLMDLKSLPPGEGDSKSDSDEDDAGFNLEMPLMNGTMGWRVYLHTRPDGGGASERERGSAGAGGSAAGRADGDDAERLANVARLEALWRKQAPEPSVPDHGSSPADMDGRGAAGSSSNSSSSIADVSPDQLEADWRWAESRAAASAASSQHNEPDNEGSRNGAGAAPGPGSGSAAGSGSRPGTGGGVRAAGGVSTDRLMRPSRRPGAGSDQVASSTSSAGDKGASAPPQPASSSAPGAEAPGEAAAGRADAGFVASTRARRGPGSATDGTPAARQNGPGRGQEESLAEQAQSQPGEEDPGSMGASEDEASSSLSRAEGGSDTEDSEPTAPTAPRLLGRPRMVRRPRPAPRPLRAGGQPPAGPATSGPGGPSSSSSAGPQPGQSAPSDGAAGASTSGAVPLPAYRHHRQPGSGSASGGTGAAASGTGANAPQPPASLGKPQRPARFGPLPPATPHASGGPGAGSGMPGGPGAHTPGAGALPPGSSPLLPPEAAGYTAMDIEQMARFVLGRQASPEEVMDLARAVAESAEVEAEYLAGAGPVVPWPMGLVENGRARYGWERPGTPPPSLEERLRGLEGGRRGRAVIVPRRRRLRIPERVLSLMGAQQLAARQAKLEEEAAAREGAERERAGRDRPAWPRGAWRRRQGPAAERQASARKEEPSDEESGPTTSGEAGETRRGGLFAGRSQQLRGGGLSPAAPPPPPPTGAFELRRLVAGAPTAARQAPRPQPPLSGGHRAPAADEAPADVAVRLYRGAAERERQQAEALVAFLRGRELPADGMGSPGAHGLGGLGRRRQGGLPGLTPGRDAVVVLPKGLLEVVAGAWQLAEERLMHPDVLRGPGVVAADEQ